MILKDILKLLQAIYSIQIHLYSWSLRKQLILQVIFFFEVHLVIVYQVYLMNTTCVLFCECFVVVSCSYVFVNSR